MARIDRMWRIFALSLLLPLAPGVLAEEVVIPRLVVGTEEVVCLEHSLDLWIRAPEEWSLQWSSLSEDLYFNTNSEWEASTLTWTGLGDCQFRQNLKVIVNVPELGFGQHDLEVDVRLQGAQGILGLPLDDHYWVLPLQAFDLQIQSLGEKYPVESNQGWFKLLPGESLHWGEDRIFQPVGDVGAFSLKNAQLYWTRPILHLEAGDLTSVELQLEGPAPAGKLFLHAKDEFQIGTTWMLGELPLMIEGCYLELPELSPGLHTIRGQIRALLPSSPVSTHLEAKYLGQSARLEIWIGRTWFDFSSKQRIQLQGRTQSFLLPQGQIVTSSGDEPLIVQVDGLDLLIPLEQPAQPLWIGIPLAESTVFTMDTGQKGKNSNFFNPIFIWDQGFRWRFVSRWGPLLFDLSPENQVLHGKAGSWSLSLTQERLGLSSSARHWREKDWQWWDSPGFYRGLWGQGAWSFILDLPKHSDKDPSWTLQYGDEHWGGRLSANDLSLHHKSPTWTWGFRVRTGTIWLEDKKKGLRLELASEGITLAYQKLKGANVSLRADLRGDVQIQLTHGAMEAYTQFFNNGNPNWGIRTKWPQARGAWNSLTQAAYERKQNFGQFELKQHLAYMLFPWATCYLEGAFRANLVDVEGDYGAGLIFQPLPQIFTSLGWHSDKGAVFRAGVVIPFVEREKEGS